MKLKPAVKISWLILSYLFFWLKIEHLFHSCLSVCVTKFSNTFALFPFLSFSPRQPVRRGTMESVPLEQSATVDELLEACIQAFGWSSEHIEFDSFQM